MQTEHIISQDVKIIRIVNLKKGDLVKILVKEYSSGYEVRYALVTDVYMNGEKTFVETMQYEVKYGDELNVSIKIYTNGDNLDVFPATLDEVSGYFKSAVERIEKKIEDKKSELLKYEKGLNKAKEFIYGELQKEIKEAEYIVCTQSEYDTEKKLKEKQELIEKANNL